ncbi:MAG: threonylcarbamoyl-AMP synthase [Bacteroidetes bacterium GWE2_29_8]|nr:MAG: threonylcarbamoyl-AMP synthase [Bacteroidetes bacterium GWE2_29_8]
MLIEIHKDNPNERSLKDIVECLKNGGVIIYPTDTVYALGCDISNNKAIEKIAKIKGVKVDKTNFSIICNDLSHISDYCKPINNNVFRVMKKALPGPFTFILKANNNVPRLLESRKKTIGIRIPDNNIARTLVRMLDNPIITTSIHHDDEIIEYLTEPYEMYEKYDNLVDYVIDGGVGGNVPSTVVDCSEDNFTVIREGKGDINDYL